MAFLFNISSKQQAKYRQKKAEKFALSCGLTTSSLIEFNNITMYDQVGEGGTSNVYKATTSNDPSKVVIAKLIKPETLDSEGLEMLRMEIRIWSNLEHASIIKFLGACLEPNRYILLCEQMNHTLREHLKHLSRHRKALSEATLVIWALCIAQGVEYMHSKDPIVLHRDLKSSNILISSDGLCKLADFGVARPKSERLEEHSGETGSYRWMAPEVLRHEAYDELCDSYSFGIVVWEMATCKLPFHTQTPMQAALGVAMGGLTPTLPQGFPMELASMCKKCWNHKPSQRPSFANIVSVLDRYKMLNVQTIGDPQSAAYDESRHSC